MSSKVPMPASGDGKGEGKSDGVNDPGERGRVAGGESGGGGYSDSDAKPHPTGDAGGFMGHGGQTDIAYHGGGQAGDEGADAPNGTTRSGGDLPGKGDTGPKPGPRGPYQDRVAEQTRDERIGGRTVEIFETSGVAAAEAAGKTGVAGQHAEDGEQPGSG